MEIRLNRAPHRLHGQITAQLLDLTGGSPQEIPPAASKQGADKQTMTNPVVPWFVKFA